MAKQRTLKTSPPPRSRGSARYATREAQATELLARIRRRDRKVYRALLVILSADARFLTALGALLELVVAQASARTRGAR